MKGQDPRLMVQAPPLLRATLSTPQAMWDVVVAALPTTCAALWFFGLPALLVVSAAMAGTLLTEWVFGPAPARATTLGNGSGVLTGLLLGLTLPPALPLWMAFLGGVVAAGLGKLVWGGLGQNLFNPALVGRTFLSAAFPSAMTTWSAPGDAHGFFHVHATNLAPPFLHVEPDALTAATPLGLMRFQHQATGAEPLALGGVAGSLGETSAVLILLGGVYLALRRDIDWRVPVGILLAVALFTGSLHLVDPVRYPGALFSLFSGGLLFGAVFMATDPVTSPLTPRGTWIFALGIGALVVLIRNFGGFPEGVMYAILLMNAATPLIERYTQPRVFGRGGRRP